MNSNPMTAGSDRETGKSAVSSIALSPSLAGFTMAAGCVVTVAIGDSGFAGADAGASGMDWTNGTYDEKMGVAQSRRECGRRVAFGMEAIDRQWF